MADRKVHFKAVRSLVLWALLIVLVFIVGLVFFMPTAKPGSVYITDAGSNSATVVWQTNRRVITKVLIAKKPNWNPGFGFWIKAVFGFFPQVQTVYDQFTLDGQPSTIHRAQVVGLQPGQSYDFVIVNGMRLYKVPSLKVQTRSLAAQPPALIAATGQVLYRKTAVGSALVLISKKSQPAVKLSTVTDTEGMWVANVGDLNVNPKDQLVIEAFTPDGRRRRVINQPGFFNPTLTIDFGVTNED